MTQMKADEKLVGADRRAQFQPSLRPERAGNGNCAYAGLIIKPCTSKMVMRSRGTLMLECSPTHPAVTQKKDQLVAKRVRRTTWNAHALDDSPDPCGRTWGGNKKAPDGGGFVGVTRRSLSGLPGIAVAAVRHLPLLDLDRHPPAFEARDRMRLHQRHASRRIRNVLAPPVARA